MPDVKIKIAKGVASSNRARRHPPHDRRAGRGPRPQSEYIFVVIDKIDADNWGRNGMTLTELWQQPKDPA